nr:hypothetical protein [Tanacetum cinerariifolium]
MDERSPARTSLWKSIKASANQTTTCTDLEMCMLALTAMDDSAWIEAMQKELFISLTDSKSGNSLTNPLTRA